MFKICFSVISAIIYTVDNNNTWADHMSHLIWLYECIAWTTTSCLTKTLDNKGTIVTNYCISTVLLKSSVGLEATQLSIHAIPYFAVQFSGCVYFHGSYSWWIERICRTSECQLDGIGCLWRDYRESVHFGTTCVSSQKYMGFIWPVEINSSTSFKI